MYMLILLNFLNFCLLGLGFLVVIQIDLFVIKKMRIGIVLLLLNDILYTIFTLIKSINTARVRVRELQPFSHRHQQKDLSRIVTKLMQISRGETRK
jgi:uncharacterized membrane protein YqjE